MKWNDFRAIRPWTVVGIVLVLGLRSGTAEEGEGASRPDAAGQPTPAATAGEPSEPSASREQIAAWVAQLDDDRYEVRERASQNLEVHSRFALDPLAVAADGPSPEAAARAVVILEGLAERASDQNLKLAVLERLVTLENRSSVSRRAQEKLAAVWEEISLPIAVEMGGRLDPDAIDMRGRQGFGKFIIGPEWTGGDEGLVHVARLGHIHTVSIRRAAISNEGIERLARSMPSLRFLELYGMGIDQDQQQDLQQQFPSIKLDVRRGAFFGVRGTHGTPLAEIQGVEPGSAAADAGLKVGDVVTKVDDVEIQSFAELTTEIAKHEPGSTAVMQVRRGGRLLERKVVFGQWE
jgi:hypothetical protein